jgi:FKBP-type peptidyl-prolyl cis-trans isomerase FkpA
LKTIINTSISLGIAFAAVSLITSCKGGSSSFKKLKNGVEYSIYEGGKGNVIADSSLVKMHIIQKIGDSVLSSTYDKSSRTGGEAVTNLITKGPGDAMDVSEALLKMKIGDSVIFHFNPDSIFKAGNPKPAFMKKNDLLTMTIKLTELFSKEKKDSLIADQAKQMEMQQKAMQEAQQKQMQETGKLAPKEDAQIQAYAKAKGIGAQKTASGLYYAITTPGAGAKPNPGQMVTMNYDGTLLDGTKFDSNIDPKFNHVKPFEFPLGQGQVIPGWDEGVALFPIGSKGVLLIPSYLAYGANPRPGSPIKPNSILRFDIEVVSAK